MARCEFYLSVFFHRLDYGLQCISGKWNRFEQYSILNRAAFRYHIVATLEKGDVVAVPNDTTNEARALLLLQDNGIITLKDGVGLEATVRDIVDNPNEIEIQELEAAQVPRVKDEVAFVVLNGNYAMEAGFSVAKDAVAYEQADSEAAKTYVNVIAVKEGNESNEAVKALVDALKSDEITEYINNTYDGGVIPFK